MKYLGGGGREVSRYKNMMCSGEAERKTIDLGITSV